MCTCDFPHGSVVKNPPDNAGEEGFFPWSDRSLGGGHGNLLQYSRLENPHGQGSLAGYKSIGSQRLRLDSAQHK